MLTVEGLAAGYGASQVLFGMDLAVEAGEVVTLIGRNGMGKTTTIRAIMGLIPIRGGAVSFAGHAVKGRASYEVARWGLGLVPEGRHIFPNLSVAENLLAMASNRLGVREPWTVERVIALFPQLQARLSNMGGQLSGGEQQMLAVGRALMTNPRLLVLDEATEGLAPLVREEIWKSLVARKALGQSILVIDKHLAKLMPIADRHYVVEKGRVVFSSNSAELEARPDVRERYIGV
jgi:branched-chain amino acid transport system ATP-binding protein